MKLRDRPSRPRSASISRRNTLPFSEFLEPRWLLAVASTTLAPAMPVVLAAPVAAPVAGLSSGLGFQSPATTLPSPVVNVSSSLAVSTAPTDNPSVTLSALPTESETAVATSSEVARPTPGRSDRIPSSPIAPEFLPIAHLRSPSSDDQDLPPAAKQPIQPEAIVPPVAPSQTPPEGQPAPQAVPTPQVAPLDIVPEPTPRPSHEVPLSLETWDRAIEFATRETIVETQGTTPWRSEAALAAGLALSFWTHRQLGPQTFGRSRKRPIHLPTLETGPGRS